MFKRINHILIAFLFCFGSSQAFSQYNEHHRSDNWLFGDKAGLKFNNGIAESINLGENEMWTPEGCASISDTLGNLLFYTDGRRVWNRNHSILLNGDSISDVIHQFGQSIFQSSLIIPNPAEESQYYLINLEVFTFDGILSYSIIDMDGDSGYGEVIFKKQNLFTKTNEKLAAIKHCNNKDYWFVVQDRDTKYYHVYLINECGVFLDSIYPTSNSNISLMGGPLKFSNSGNKLFNQWTISSKLQFFSNEYLEISDFNNCTGVLNQSNYIRTFHSASELWYTYGFEITEDEKYLFSTKSREIPGTIANDSLTGETVRDWVYEVIRYDVSSNDSNQILNSKTIISSDTSFYSKIGYLSMPQIANNGKIYCANIDASSINLLDNINQNPVFYFDTITLNTGSNLLGLPNFVTDFKSPEYFFIDNICMGDSTKIRIANLTNADSILIEIPAIGLTTNATFFKHKFLLSGEYEIILSVYDSIYINQFKKKFLIRDIDLIEDKEFVLCKDSSIVVTLDDCDYIDVIWDSTNGNTLFIDSAGQYNVQVSDRFGCVFEDSINVEFKILNTEITSEISYPLCHTETLVLTASSDDNNVLFSWNDLSQNSNINITESGVYSVTVKDSLNCLAFDTIQINFTDCEDSCSAFDRFINQNLFIGNSEFNSEELSEYFKLMEFEIYDSKGSFIFKDEQFDSGTFNHLASGIYFVHFTYLCVFNDEIRTKSIKIAKIR